MLVRPCCLQAEQANKEATASPGSGQGPVTEDAVTVPSPTLAAAKAATQPLGPLAPG